MIHHFSYNQNSRINSISRETLANEDTMFQDGRVALW